MPRVFLLIAIFLYVSPVFAGSCKESLLRLVNKGAFIHQTDRRLYRLGLIAPQGGLCGPTCAINSLHAIGDYMGVDTSYFRNHPEYAMAELLKLLSAKFPNRDPREGTFLEMYKDVLPAYAKQTLGVDIAVRVEKETSSQHFPDTGFELPSSTLGIFSAVSDADGGGHVLQLFDINTSKQIIGFIDPHHPKRIDVTRYHYFPEDTAMYLEDFFPKFQFPRKGLVKSFITIEALGVQANPYEVSRDTVQNRQWKIGYVLKDGKRIRVEVNDSYDRNWALVRGDGESWLVKKSDVFQNENRIPSESKRKGYILRDGKRILVEIGEDYETYWTFVEREGERWLVNKPDILPYVPSVEPNAPSKTTKKKASKKNPPTS